MASAGEPADVSDLGDDQHRRVAADAADLAQHCDAVFDLACWSISVLVVVVVVISQSKSSIRDSRLCPAPAWRSRSGTVARNWRPAFPNRSERVREVRVIAGVLKQLGEPFPAAGRLDRDLTLALQAAEQLQELSSAETRCRCHLSGMPRRLTRSRARCCVAMRSCRHRLHDDGGVLWRAASG
jgi:hypothetical protein